MFTVGQVVFSKRGRDKGLPFVIVLVDGEYCYLSDGDIRKLNKPKKKKQLHIQPTNDVLPDLLRERLLGEANGPDIMDSDIRKALVKYRGCAKGASSEELIGKRGS